ncbi:MAG: hypothetical protein PHV53_02080, partial [Fermentimonas sp.]|nr:hypothetical protein [Fermentimonas sp.]
KSTFLILILFFLSCAERQQKPIYANNDEILIIDKMDCWKSVEAESLLTSMALAQDNSSKKWKKWRSLNDDVKVKGRKSLRNDTLFIDIIRNDSIYKHMLTHRQILSNKIKNYSSKIPFFQKEINKISNDIIEYNYNRKDEWGLYLSAKDFFIPYDKFYSNYSDYLKDGYSLVENANVKESYILEFNDILKQIEVLDRKLWMMKHFESAKIEVEKEFTEQKRKQEIDSLFKD